jgi:hypothetical protein
VGAGCGGGVATKPGRRVIVINAIVSYREYSNTRTKRIQKPIPSAAASQIIFFSSAMNFPPRIRFQVDKETLTVIILYQSIHAHLS